MKHSLLILSIVALLSSCGNSDKNKAVNEVKQDMPSVKEKQPGKIATKEDGWSMKAKINGKDIIATSMMPPDETEQIIGFYSGDKYIGLPFNRQNMIMGKKMSFSDQNADLTTNDDVKVWYGGKGEMEITKVFDKWVEGKFYFTAYSYDNKKTIEVTDGFFRISMEK